MEEKKSVYHFMMVFLKTQQSMNVQVFIFKAKVNIEFKSES